MNRISSSGQRSAWLWLAVLIVAVAAYGCGGGEEAESPPDDEATAGGPPGMGAPPPSPPQPPAQKPTEEPKPEEQPLPEDVSEWVKEHYYQAKKTRDPRLPEAVAYLGEHFAGTDGADSAAQLLTNLLEKSEEPEPEPRQQPGPRQGTPSSMGSGSMGPPEMGSSMGPPEGSAYEDDGAAGATGMDEEESYPEEYPGPDGMPSGIGSGARFPGAPGGTRMRGANAELVEAIVRALGVNNSATAKQTLKRVLEGTFETDDNRTATLTTVDAFVAHLCPEYEELVFRCLTAPETLRELGKTGPSGPSGRPEYGSGSAGPYGGMYSSMGGRSDAAPLTAEELQRHAFAAIAPVASEEFRAKLARHLVKPDTVREDHDLFGGYLREMNPDNLAAQMVFYLDPRTDDETKQTVEENFLAYSSDALAGILGLPAEQRAAIAARRSDRGARDRGRGIGGGSAGMGPEMGMEEEPGDMGSAEFGAMGAEEDYGGPVSPLPGGRSGLPGSSSDSGRPSRYDAGRDQSADSSRPSRYDTHQPGATGTAIGQPEFQPEDPDLPYRLARHLWGSEMVKPLENRLNGAGTLEGNARLVLLASTLPVDSTRATLYQMLKRNSQDGPSALESAGLLDYVVSDPGFLAVVKMLPRKSPEPEAGPGRPTGRTRMGRGRTRSDRGSSPEEMGMEPSMPRDYEEEMSGPPGRMMRGDRRPARVHPEPKGPEEAWMFTSEDLVRVVCERLLAAGRAGAGTTLPPPKEEQPLYGLPFHLRDDAMVVGEYHLDWPGDVADKLSGVSLGGLRIHYVRAEQTAKLSTMESYYRRQLGSPEIRPIQDGTWLDLVTPVPDTDWKRSIDVMCTATVPAGEEFDKKAELPVTMDVLCIDIKDPAPAGEGG